MKHPLAEAFLAASSGGPQTAWGHVAQGPFVVAQAPGALTDRQIAEAIAAAMEVGVSTLQVRRTRGQTLFAARRKAAAGATQQ